MTRAAESALRFPWARIINPGILGSKRLAPYYARILPVTWHHPQEYDNLELSVFVQLPCGGAPYCFVRHELELLTTANPSRSRVPGNSAKVSRRRRRRRADDLY